MHTVELLSECLTVAQRLGYKVRQEWLGGIGGGACDFGGHRWIFVDLGLNANEQLEQAASALREDPELNRVELSPPLSRILELRRAA